MVHTCDFGFLLVLLTLVCRNAADEGMLLLWEMLVHVLLDLKSSFDTTALRHTIIKQDEFVGVTLASISLLDPVDCLVSIDSCIALYLKLHE